jgi:hypothetical protein
LVLGKFDRDDSNTIKKRGNGVYAFILSGNITINGQELGTKRRLQDLDVTA